MNSKESIFSGAALSLHLLVLISLQNKLSLKACGCWILELGYILSFASLTSEVFWEMFSQNSNSFFITDWRTARDITGSLILNQLITVAARQQMSLGGTNENDVWASTLQLQL